MLTPVLTAALAALAVLALAPAASRAAGRACYRINGDAYHRAQTYWAAARKEEVPALTTAAASRTWTVHDVALLGLEVAHVDFLRGTITVEQQLQQAERGKDRIYIGPPKTATSHRSIPVPTTVTDALAAHLAKYPAQEGTVPYGKPDGEKRSARFIFSTRRRPYITPSTFLESAWVPAVRTAGLAGTGMHMMRHSYASALISAGLSVKVVSARLGHADASETLNIYTHLFPDDEDRTREAVAAWLSIDVPPMCPKEG